MTIFCYNCGNELSSANKFCPACGAQNIYAEPQPVNVAPVQPAPPAQSAPPASFAPKAGNGFGVASLVLGIISLVFFCFLPLSGLLALISFPLGLVGISKSKKNGSSSGSSVGGVVCSSIALAIALVEIIFFAGIF